MMIGILTFQNTLNYGAVLQAYALNRIINRYADCETIDYRCACVEERERIKKLSETKSIKELIKYTAMHNKLIKKQNKIKKFTQENMKISNKIYTKKNIEESQKIYDKYIVGSDQVWNYQLTDSDFTYLLDFIDQKKGKYSYAASFGLDKILENKEKYKDLLSKFDKISVREEQGRKIVEELTERQSIITLDPTFLLTKQEWEELIKDVTIQTKDYIGFYQMQESTELLKYAQKLAKEQKCDIINLLPYFKDLFKSKTFIDASPQEWLKIIESAKYMIINSFHGLVFSIIFNKDFIVEVPNNKHKTSSRLENLLKLLELEERNINSEKFNPMKEIDWDKINKKLDDYRNMSIKYIEAIIKE